MSALRLALFTAPAPAIATKVTEHPTALPISRPTAVPSEEALLAGLTPDAPVASALPLDLTVPRRVPSYEGFVTTLSHRAACLLLHVDGSSTLAQIAAHTALPHDVVFEVFLELLGSGVVELDAADGAPSTPASPASGVFRKSVPNL